MKITNRICSSWDEVSHHMCVRWVLDVWHENLIYVCCMIFISIQFILSCTPKQCIIRGYLLCFLSLPVCSWCLIMSQRQVCPVCLVFGFVSTELIGFFFSVVFKVDRFPSSLFILTTSGYSSCVWTLFCTLTSCYFTLHLWVCVYVTLFGLSIYQSIIICLSDYWSMYWPVCASVFL